MPPFDKLQALLGLNNAIGLSIVLSVAAFLGKWLFDELTAKNKIRRDFAVETGKQIAALANKHYWAIANAAGTLSDGLRVYLEEFELGFYVRWGSISEFAESSRKYTRDVALETFPSLVQLVWSLHNFQFLDSNDYLLPDRAAGTHLRRLYNAFLQSLRSVDEDEDLVTGILQIEMWKEKTFDLQAILNAASMRELNAQELRHRGMQRLSVLWEHWLARDLANVLRATDALETFSRVLQYELAELYGDWFRDRKAETELDGVERAVRRSAWFGMLTGAELASLSLAREQGDFMTAMRRTSSGSRVLARTTAAPAATRPDSLGSGPGPVGPDASGGVAQEGARAAVETGPTYVDPRAGGLGAESLR